MMPPRRDRKPDPATVLLEGIRRNADPVQARTLARTMIALMDGHGRPTAMLAAAWAIASQIHAQADEELGDAIVHALGVLVRFNLAQLRDGEMAERLQAGSATDGSA
jgi:allophanate hydrolase subunit 1